MFNKNSLNLKRICNRVSQNINSAKLFSVLNNFEQFKNKEESLCQTKIFNFQPLRTHTKEITGPCSKSCQTLKVDSCMVDPCYIDPCIPQPKVIIIGAGMAGLSAAQKLSMSGYKNFLVLEGTDRPGGRIHSCWLGNSVGELGAQWISGGSEANPIFTLACMEGLLRDPLSVRNVSDMVCLTSDGRAIDVYTASIGKGIFQNVEKQAFSLFSIDTDKGHGTLRKFMETRICEELRLVPEEWRVDAGKIAFAMFNTIKSRWGSDLEFMSADAYGSFIKIPGQAVRVPLGLVGTLGPLLKTIDKDRIRYCQEVNSIKWDNESPRVSVKTCEGNKYDGDYCIITCSLGVLKAQHNTLFQPSLPEEKIQAIKTLGYGHLNKIIMEYNRPFWACGEGSLFAAWNTNELAERNCWTKGVAVIEEVPDSGNMLMTTVGGPEACKVEECSDTEVALEIAQMLRNFTGDFSLPIPSNIIRSKWSSDKFFLGALSFLGLHAKVTDQCELGRPLQGACSNSSEPALLFAGEATSPGHFGTVQGARLSGLREAERVIQLVIKNRGPPKKVKSSAFG